MSTRGQGLENILLGRGGKWISWEKGFPSGDGDGRKLIVAHNE